MCMFKDSEHHLVVNDFVDIRVYQNESAVLPCLPTHPDTEITLFNEQNEKVSVWKYLSVSNHSHWQIFSYSYFTQNSS